MGRAFEEGRFADFSLICEGKIIKIAKAVVGPQSGFFGTLFETDMKESKIGEAEIPNMSYETLRLLVRYLYCGGLPGHQITRVVLTAADYLNIASVKEIYEEHALQNMTLESVHEMLVNAKTFKMENLMQNCVEFLSKNENWKSVMHKLVDIVEPLM